MLAFSSKLAFSFKFPILSSVLLFCSSWKSPAIAGTWWWPIACSAERQNCEEMAWRCRYRQALWPPQKAPRRAARHAERCFLQETTRGSLSSFRKLKYLWNWKQTGASTGEKTKSAFKKLQSLRIHLSIRSKFSSSFLPKSKKKHPKRGRAAQSSAAKAQCQAARRGGRAPLSSPRGTAVKEGSRSQCVKSEKWQRFALKATAQGYLRTVSGSTSWLLWAFKNPVNGGTSEANQISLLPRSPCWEEYNFTLITLDK